MKVGKQVSLLYHPPCFHAETLESHCGRRQCPSVGYPPIPMARGQHLPHNLIFSGVYD